MMARRNRRVCTLGKNVPQPHQIARLDLRAELPDGAAAARLRARIENLGWRLLPRAIERTIEAFGPIDGHLRIERLALDLGTVSAANLETETLAALERALAAALRDALGNARHAPTPQLRLQDEAAWRLEQYEGYLATGTVANPARGEPFVPEIAFALLAQTQPVGLVTAVRRRARAPHVLERLVAQLDAAALGVLLSLLAPADARAILELLAQTLLAHCTAPLDRFVRLQAAELERTLWIATLEFLLRDPGSQFNRRRYLEYLLRREARRTGMGYEALLALLARALDVVQAAFGVTATLPLTLGELLAERGFAAARPTGTPAAMRSHTRDAAASQADAALEHLRKLAQAADPAPFEAAAHGLSQAELERVVASTAPFDRAAIRRTFADIEKLLPAGVRPAAARAVALRALLAQAARGTFDVAAWRRALMRQIAARDDLPPVLAPHPVADAAAKTGRRLRRGQVQLAALRARWAEVASAVAAEAARAVGAVAQNRPHGTSVAAFETLLAEAVAAVLASASAPPRDEAAVVATALAALGRSGDAAIRKAAEAAAAAVAPPPPGARSRIAESDAAYKRSQATPAAAPESMRDAASKPADATDAAALLSARARERGQGATAAGSPSAAPAHTPHLGAAAATDALRDPASDPAQAVEAAVDFNAGESLQDILSADLAARDSARASQLAAMAAAFAAAVEADGTDAKGEVASRDGARASHLAAMVAAFAAAFLAQIANGPTVDPPSADAEPTDRRRAAAARGYIAAFAHGAPLLATSLAAAAASEMLARSIAAALGRLQARIVQAQLQAHSQAHAAEAVDALHTMLRLAAAYVDARRGTAIAVPSLVAHVARMQARAHARRTLDPPQRRAALRLRHAGRRDPRGLALLATEAADLASVPRLALLAALAPGHATEVAASVAGLLHAFARRTADMPAASALERLVWTQVFSYLATYRGARLGQAALQAHVLAALSQALDDDLGDVAQALAAPVPAAASTAPETDAGATADVAALLSEVGRFLRYGRPHAAAYRLVAAAERAPAALAAIAREIAAESPSLVPAMLERLLAVLAPDVLAACFDPAYAEAAADALPRDRGPSLDAFFAALLAGRIPSPPQPAKLGTYIDALLALRQSLDAEADAAADALRARLPALSLGELAWLVLTPDARHSLARLKRAVASLAPDRVDALLAKIAPWADDTIARLAQMRGAPPPADIGDVRLRAALAGLADDKFDIAKVAAEAADATPATEPVRHAPGSDESLPGDAVPRQKLFAWLGGAAVAPAQIAAYAAAFADLADGDDPALAAFVASVRGRPRVQAHWAASLPLGARARLLGLLAKPKARQLLDVALLASAAWRQTAPFGAPRPNEQAIWSVLFAALAVPQNVDPAEILAQLVDAFAGRDATLATQLRRRLANLTRDGGHAALAAAVRRPQHKKPRPAPDAASAPPKNAAPRDTRKPSPKGPLYVENAGLVLLGPFLPQLFARLDVLATPEGEAPRMRDLAAATRAVHLLQYLADSRLDAPEPQLVLNKVLCGLQPADAVERRHDATEEELSICESLLRTVVANWTVMRNTGAVGLREAFLRRAGRLTLGAERCDLKVERKGMDVLIARIPWSIALVKHRWMPAPLYVDW
jgi:hypothetical protein